MGEQAKVEVEMTSEDMKLWQSFQRVAREASKAEGAIKQTGQAVSRTAREQDRLNRAAKRMTEELRTPQEKYNAQIRELSGHLKGARISQETYNRAVRQAKQGFREAEAARLGAFGPSAVSQLRSAALQVVGIHEAVRLVATGLRSVDQQFKELGERQLAGVEASGKLRQLARTDPDRAKMLKEMRNTLFREGAAKSLEEAASYAFAIESAGATEHSEFYSKIKSWFLIDDIKGTAGAVETMRTTMGAENVGDPRDVFNKALGVSEVAPATAEQLLVAAAGAGVSASLMAGDEYKGADEDVLAAAAVAAKAKFSAEQGGTYLNQMYRTLKAKGAFEGMALEDIILEVDRMRSGGQDAQDFFETKGGIKRLQELGFDEEEAESWMEHALDRERAAKEGMTTEEWAMSRYVADDRVSAGMSPEQFREWFGRAQGQEMFEVLARDIKSKDSRFKHAREQALRAEDKDFVASQINMAKLDLETAAGRERIVQSNRKELAAQDVAQLENMVSAVRDNIRANLREKHGVSRMREMSRGLEEVFAGLNKGVYGPESYLASALEWRGDDMDSDVRQLTLRSLRKYAYTTGNLDLQKRLAKIARPEDEGEPEAPSKYTPGGPASAVGYRDRQSQPQPAPDSGWKTSFSAARRIAAESQGEPGPRERPVGGGPASAVAIARAKADSEQPAPLVPVAGTDGASADPPADTRPSEPPTSIVPVIPVAEGARSDVSPAPAPAPIAIPAPAAPPMTSDQGDLLIEAVKQVAANTAQRTGNTSLGVQATAPAPEEDR